MAENAEENVDDFDFDDNFDESIPCSFSYVSICIFFPACTGMLGGILWSGFSLYVREMGWSLSQAGVVVAIGAIARILVQQTILRVGLWTSALISALHLTGAILAISFTEQEWAILLEATCAAMLDVTVAVEALAFDQWSDSEIMVSQAQSTVLALFTIACALAATIGGIVFDFAGWKGITFCHAGCCSLQLLCIISQPTTWRSLKETFYGREEDDSDAALESVVPATGTTKKAEEVEELETVQEETELADVRPSQTGPVPLIQEQAEDQPTSQRGSVALAEEAEWKEAAPELPGAVQDEEQAEDPEGQKKKPRKSKSPGNRGSMTSGHSSGTDGTGSLPLMQLASRISHHTNRQSVVSARSNLRGRPSSKSRLSANTKGSGRSVTTHSTNKTGKSNKTMGTVMSKLSAFTNGENFEHHYALRNALLPQVASRNAQVQLQEVDEDDEIPSTSGRATKKAKATLPRDVYIPAALLMMASFCNNLSYSMEWTVYAVYFREQHNWQSATWAGVAQTAGDLLAAFTMSIFKGGARPDLDDYEGIRRYWMAIRAQPYNMSCLLFWWIILSAAIMAPNLAVAVAAQVVMGTVYVFFAKTLTDLNLFFSLGESEIFMKLQVQCRNADSLAVLIASSCGLTMYENFFPESPFLLSFGLACFVFSIFTAGFCHRLGFGIDIETAEERRARRKGLRRVSSWKSVTTKKSHVEMED